MDEIATVQLCRICLANGADIPIFEENEDEPYNILSKLALCLKEKVKYENDKKEFIE